MRFVPADETHVQWITKKLSLLKVEDAKGIVCLSDSGQIMAVCVMDTWTQGSVQIHIAIDNPMCLRNNALLVVVFHYIFNVADRHTAVGLVNSDNLKALRFDKKIGFREIARIKDGYSENIDTVILELRREDCQWINSKKEAA